jgi:hypothetical protein
MPTPRQPFINERPQVTPEPEVVPIKVPQVDPAPPRRFAPLASIEPEDNTPEPSPEPAYQEPADEPVHAVKSSHVLNDPDLGVPMDDDLDVPAFIRRKVE